jgi:hypothetical protein
MPAHYPTANIQGVAEGRGEVREAPHRSDEEHDIRAFAPLPSQGRGRGIGSRRYRDARSSAAATRKTSFWTASLIR